VSAAAAEVADYRASVRGDLEGLWPSPRVAGEPDAGGVCVRAVRHTTVAQEWTEPGLLGARAALAGSTFELGVRLSIKWVIGTGTNEILRDPIARSVVSPR
jgi:hypothetical protein